MLRRWLTRQRPRRRQRERKQPPNCDFHVLIIVKRLHTSLSRSPWRHTPFSMEGLWLRELQSSSPCCPWFPRASLCFSRLVLQCCKSAVSCEAEESVGSWEIKFCTLNWRFGAHSRHADMERRSDAGPQRAVPGGRGTSIYVREVDMWRLEH